MVYYSLVYILLELVLPCLSLPNFLGPEITLGYAN